MREREQVAALVGEHLYRLDLARWWDLLRAHLAHPSADVTVVALTPDHELVMRSDWDWAGMKSTLDQIMAVATTQLLEDISAAAPVAPAAGDD